MFLKVKYILKRILVFTFAFAVLLQPLCMNFFAKADNDSDDKAVEKSAEEIINSVEVESNSAKEPLKTMPTLPKTTYTSDFSWSADQMLKGVYSSCELYFKLPNYWSTKYAYVKIKYRMSSIISDYNSSLTFSINGEAISSAKLSYNNGESQVLYIQIPIELLNNTDEKADNVLQISGYARMFNEENCLDNTSDANWISLSKNSSIICGYELSKGPQQLSAFPFPYISSIEKSGKNTAVEILTKGDNNAVSTALLVANTLGKNCEDENDIAVGPYDEIDKENRKNKIIIGLKKDLPESLQDKVSDFQEKLETNLLILATADDKGNNVLIITSNKSEALLEATSYLSDDSRIIQTHLSSILIQIGSSTRMAEEKKQNALNVNQYTLEEITGSGLSFIGANRQERTLFLPVSDDFALSSSSKFNINFRYSKNIDYTRSTFTVYWGDIPIASKKLSAENADGDNLTFSVPTDVVGTKSSSMKFAFILQIPDKECITKNDTASWAYISKDSTFYLENNNNTFMTFDNLPAPFQKNGFLNDLCLITSNDPTQKELTLLSKIMDLYAKNCDPYSTLKVRKVSEFDEKSADFNIITAGTPTSNEIIKQLNDKLFFKFNDNGTQFLTNSKLILNEGYAQDLGSMQLLSSPYAENRALLVLTGPTDKSLTYISNLISDKELHSKINKDCVLIDSQGKSISYQFKNIKLDDNKPTFSQMINNNKTSILFSLAGTAVMIILFLATILIVIRARRTSKNKKK